MLGSGEFVNKYQLVQPTGAPFVAFSVPIERKKFKSSMMECIVVRYGFSDRTTCNTPNARPTVAVASSCGDSSGTSPVNEMGICKDMHLISPY